MVNLGNRGLMYARDVVATAALRGQAQLAQQLTQRSYSMDDVSSITKQANVKSSVRVTEIREETDSNGDEITEENQVRTWTGVYDDNGRVIEQSVFFNIFLKLVAVENSVKQIKMTNLIPLKRKFLIFYVLFEKKNL